MPLDETIVTIYDMKNDGKPLNCHRADAREFLSHPSKRWAASPDGNKKTVDASNGKKTPEDSGEAMLLKEMTLDALKAMAKKEEIEGFAKLKKAELVEAILTKREADKNPVNPDKVALESMELEELQALAEKAIAEKAEIPEGWEKLEKDALIETLLSAIEIDKE